MGNALVLNKDFKIVMSNSMVKGKQDVLTLWQHKIFRLLISQIKPSDMGLETYTCKITDLISSCSCNNGILTIRLNDDVKPFVLQQKGFYTQYEIGSILNFKSVYAIRLYEILLSDFKASFFSRHKFEYSIERLRQLVGCEDKLLKFSQFKDKCLCKAIIEINKSDTSEFTLTAKYHKNGRAVEGVSFILLGRSECFLPCDDYYDIITTTTEWNESWAEPDAPI